MKRVLYAIFVLSLIGCASTQEIMEKPLIVEKSTDFKHRPVWATETFSEKDGVYYFSGVIDGGHDLAVSIRQAKAEAMKNISESMATTIRQEFTEVVEGDNQEGDLARWMSDGIAWAVKNIYVSGVKQRDVYYERMYNPIDADVTYTAFALLELSKADYLRSRRDAIKKLKGYFHKKKQYEAEERAKKLPIRLLKKISERGDFQ